MRPCQDFATESHGERQSTPQELVLRVKSFRNLLLIVTWVPTCTFRHLQAGLCAATIDSGMLLVAISRSSLLGRLERYSTQQFNVAKGWLLTAVTDGFLSRVEVSRDEIVASESVLGSSNRGPDVQFISARFVQPLRTLEICKSTVSGRPVYYFVSSDGGFFASTHIKLLRQVGIAIEEDADVIPELLVYRTVAAPRTLYRDIRQLPASGRIVVRVEEQGCSSVVSDGYTPPDEMISSNHEVDVSSRVTESLRGSIKALHPAARSVATLLSGGLDSSILCSLVEAELGAYDTYSSSYPFEDQNKDYENAYALSAASALSTRHTVFVPTSLDFLVGLVEALAVAEVPLDHLQSVLFHLMFKYAIPGLFDTIVCGEGADSAWGLAMHLMLRRAAAPRQRVLAREPLHAGLRMAGRFWPKALALSKDLDTMAGKDLPLSDPQCSVWALGAYGDAEWVKAHYSCSGDDIIRNRLEGLQWAADKCINDVISLYSLHGDVACTAAVWSKLGEGQRKIIYYPFITKEALDLALSIPWEAKLRKPKNILLQAGRKLGISDVILNRQKRSFGIHSDRWAEKGGLLEPLIPVAAKVVDIQMLRSLQGTATHSAMTLWSLLNYAILKRLFILGEPLEDLLNEIRENRKSRALVSTPLPQNAKVFS